MRRMRHNKKGIEMSLNFLVTIIIALVIFMFGIRFIYNLAASSNDLRDISVDQLDNRIGQLLCDNTDKVCIGIDRKTIPRGKFDVFGIKVINIQDAQSFDVIVERPTPSGFNKAKQPIANDLLYFQPATRTIHLERNQDKEIAIGIQVPKTAESGTYIFDIRVMPYDQLHKLYVEVP